MKPRVQAKFIGFVASSIDGRIGKDKKEKSNTWTSKEDWNFFQKSLLSFNAVIVGHSTYKTGEKNLKKRNTIVFTSKVKKEKVVGTVTFINPKFVSVFKLVSERGYKKIAILGGPSVYVFFLKNKKLHELYVTIEPLVFSAGVPMFSGKYKKNAFTLVSLKKLNKNGTLLLKYKYEN